jgi:Cu-Zn family superoxide dismutase
VKTELIGTDGGAVGTAVIDETQAGVRVTVSIDSLEPGAYRYVFFDTPSCEPPDFSSAGEPYPGSAETGMLHNMSPALDRSIGRLTVSADGSGRSEDVAPVVTLGDSGNSLLEGGGTALVILELTPGGRRRACGVIKPRAP